VVTVAARDGRAHVVRATDIAGKAQFENLTPGEYVIDVDAPGFTAAPSRFARTRSRLRSRSTWGA
jgi:hypothetical protein